VTFKEDMMPWQVQDWERNLGDTPLWEVVQTQKVPDTLRELYYDQGWSGVFNFWLGAEFATENLHFLMAVDRFKQSGDAGQGREIYGTFVRDGAQRQVNISARHRIDLDAAFAAANAPPSDVFDAARTEIWQLTESDSFRRFAAEVNAVQASMWWNAEPGRERDNVFGQESGQDQQPAQAAVHQDADPHAGAAVDAAHADAEIKAWDNPAVVHVDAAQADSHAGSPAIYDAHVDAEVKAWDNSAGHAPAAQADAAYAHASELAAALAAGDADAALWKAVNDWEVAEEAADAVQAAAAYNRATELAAAAAGGDAHDALWNAVHDWEVAEQVDAGHGWQQAAAGDGDDSDADS
jgi:hypothetical protein